EVTTRYTPTVQWSERLASWSIHPEYVVVGQPEFYVRVELLLHRTPVAVMRDYLRMRLLDNYADTLGRAFVAENFRFYGQALSGRKEQQPRWKRVLEAEDEAIGMLLGKAFVHDYFPPATRQRYAELVEAIRGAYRDRIDKLDWMGPETKAKAQAK